MQEWVVGLFQNYREAAVLISILLNIGISILGVVPSVFLTAANIVVFGPVGGTAISAIGEAAGAAVSFFLYRKGFKRWAEKQLPAKRWIQTLLTARGKDAFLMIIGLRILPFVPSGLVTFAAAIGSVGASTFIAASTIGKIPALLIEAYSVYQVTQWTVQGKLILIIFSIIIMYLGIKNRRT
ncbi:TVP38/TMEM64 family protein [Neobacillus notoginsengisoli]|uniref:TVP38/TMEM64 family membrane protein n=1 Tax=Neobacillus notoginsengisoli TaxID=1578198 RepID=A0A417YSJ1_9BACI|nr:VTT domain-containing protein [Neobacillus notoginsengisoli]RHW38975.1 TVP38/TMEM64 family protein [Neobacillus notoginsengisoli]